MMIFDLTNMGKLTFFMGWELYTILIKKEVGFFRINNLSHNLGEKLLIFLHILK